MRYWRPTTALIRAVCVAALGLGLAVLLGDPAPLVIAGPFALLAGLGLLHRPAKVARLHTEVDHVSLHEGQGTRSRLVIESDPDDVEHVSRVAVQEPYLAMHPADGNLGHLRPGRPDVPDPVLEISPRRWGARQIGVEMVALTSRWSGFRAGPSEEAGMQMWVLPQPAAFDARAPVPQPLGLVGAHRSRRTGDGSEFHSIRAYRPGDRLRRISWRVSSRTQDLQVVSALAEEDAGVLLLVDALADHGASEGVDGAASSLDVTMRAASAVAEHHIRTGDRVALRVIGAQPQGVGLRAGQRQLHRIQGMLARVRPGEPRDLDKMMLNRVPLGATAGTIVILLTPMLSSAIATAAGTFVHRGLTVLVIDTLPDHVTPAVGEGQDPGIAGLAWRIRRLERDTVLASLRRAGCPVVRWRGPGTLDEVLLRLARRAQLPQVRAR